MDLKTTLQIWGPSLANRRSFRYLTLCRRGDVDVPDYLA